MYILLNPTQRGAIMTNETKHPGGRPTDYKPEYCEVVIRLMRKGASIAELARKFDCAITTIYEWIAKNDEFSYAIRKGVDLSRGWWEKNGRINLHEKSFNHILWMMNMRNRFRAEWSEKQEEKTDTNGDEIQKDRELLHKCKTE
jgi:hypothetical protein